MENNILIMSLSNNLEKNIEKAKKIKKNTDGKIKNMIWKNMSI